MRTSTAEYFSEKSIQSFNERMSNATSQKSDSWDAFCIAKVLFARPDDLPDANP